MRAIDADALKRVIYEDVPMKYFNARNLDKAYQNMLHLLEVVNQRPTLDVMPVVRCKDCTKWDKSTMRHYEDVIFGSGDTAECRMFCDMDTWGEFTDDMRRTDGNWFCADGEPKEDSQ